MDLELLMSVSLINVFVRGVFLESKCVCQGAYVSTGYEMCS